MLPAEGDEIGDGRKAVLVGYFVDALGGQGEVPQDVFGLALGDPFVGGGAEGFLEPTFEGVQTDVGPFGKVGEVVYLEIVFVDEVSEVAVLADEGVEEGGQFLLSIIGAQEDVEFANLQLVEVYAAQAVFEEVAQVGEVFLEAGSYGQESEPVPEVLGEVLGQLLDGEAVAQAEVAGGVETDERAVLEDLDVRAAVAGLQGEVSRCVQDLVEVVGGDEYFSFEHEDQGRLSGVDDLSHPLREL